jgi:hypothetical protein
MFRHEYTRTCNSAEDEVEWSCAVMRQLIPSSSEFCDCATLSMHSISQRHIAMCATPACSSCYRVAELCPAEIAVTLPTFSINHFVFHYKGNVGISFLIKQHIMKICGEGEVYCFMHLTWALGGLSGQRYPPGRFVSEKRGPDMHCVARCLCPRVGLESVDRRKVSCPCRKSNPDSYISQSNSASLEFRR